MNLTNAGTGLRPLRASDRTVLLDLLCDPAKNPKVQRWWDDADPALVDGLIGGVWPELTALAVTFQNQAVGLIQFEQETDPKYRHASIDLCIADAFQGRGIGSAALRLVIGRLADLGHHRIMIDPDAANTRAIKLYERLGFRLVGNIPKAVFSRATGQQETIALMVLILPHS